MSACLHTLFAAVNIQGGPKLDIQYIHKFPAIIHNICKEKNNYSIPNLIHPVLNSSHPTPPPSSPSSPYEFSILKHVFLGQAMDIEASVRHVQYSSTELSAINDTNLETFQIS